MEAVEKDCEKRSFCTDTTSNNSSTFFDIYHSVSSLWKLTAAKKRDPHAEQDMGMENLVWTSVPNREKSKTKRKKKHVPSHCGNTNCVIAIWRLIDLIELRREG